jgi:hypothetical protein
LAVPQNLLILKLNIGHFRDYKIQSSSEMNRRDSTQPSHNKSTMLKTSSTVDNVALSFIPTSVGTSPSASLLTVENVGGRTTAEAVLDSAAEEALEMFSRELMVQAAQNNQKDSIPKKLDSL